MRRPSMTVLVPLGLVAMGLALASSCMRRVEPNDAQLTASSIGQAQSVIRTFRKLIGRDPGAGEIQALKNLEHPEMVKKILASQQFETEGFFNLNRERLALNREGSQAWLTNSYDDFCSVRLEMADQAREDRAGKGFFETLRYRDRWIRLSEIGFGVQECFFGTDLALLSKAYKAMATPPPEGTVPTPEETLAQTCVQNLGFELFPDAEDPTANELKTFFEKVDALPPAEQKKGLVSLPEGEEMMRSRIEQSLRMKPTANPNNSGGSVKIELVKDAAGIELLRELGTKGNQRCRFVRIDPAAFVWKPEELNPSFGGGFGDDDDSAPPPPPPMAPAVGVPEQPIILDPTTPGAAQTFAKADGRLYLKVRVAPEYGGIHASPYWLSRHSTKAKNKHLHRARALYFSYFCAEINPDAANFQGGAVQDVPEPLKPYFAPDDEHAKGSVNCFNCHAKIQPMANWFGKLSWGSPYAPGADEQVENNPGAFAGPWPKFRQTGQGVFDRPGGIWEGTAFFPMEGATDRGMEGLANAMSRYPLVRGCMVDATWAALVGRDTPLWDDERAQAIKAFDGPDGVPRMSRLVEHFTTAMPRGLVYFSKGEADFAKMKQEVSYTCPEAPDDAHRQRVLGTIEGNAGNCADCHASTFFNEAGKFDMDYYFADTGGAVAEDTPKNRGKLVQNLYCKIQQGKMPPPSSGVTLDTAARNEASCYFQRLRDQLVAVGKIPADFKEKACPGQPAPVLMAAEAPHSVVGTPPAAGTTPPAAVPTPPAATPAPEGAEP